jgi:hypothetical protein
MKSRQAWVWLTAGVLALGLNGIYHDGGAACVARSLNRVLAPIVSRSGAVLALATGRADWFLAKADVAAAREETASCRLATAMARWRTKRARRESGWARPEQMSADRETQLARFEADRARIQAQIEARIESRIDARMEAQLAQVRILPASFQTLKIPNVCPRVRVSVPRVSVPVVQMGGSPI